MSTNDPDAQRGRWSPPRGRRRRTQGFAASAVLALSAGSALWGAGTTAASPARPQADVAVHLTGTSTALDGSTFADPGGPNNEPSNPLQWTDLALRSGASVTHTVTFKVAADTNLTATVGAVVVPAGFDPKTANNSAITTITLGAGGPCTTSGDTVNCTYQSADAEQSLAVPASVDALTVVAIGAAGGSYLPTAPSIEISFQQAPSR